MFINYALEVSKNHTSQSHRLYRTEVVKGGRERKESRNYKNHFFSFSNKGCFLVKVASVFFGVQVSLHRCVNYGFLTYSQILTANFSIN